MGYDGLYKYTVKNTMAYGVLRGWRTKMLKQINFFFETTR